MKRNLFSFMLALLAVGAMLVTGCKKYDDDISGTNTEVDKVKTELAELEAALVVECGELQDQIDTLVDYVGTPGDSTKKYNGNEAQTLFALYYQLRDTKADLARVKELEGKVTTNAAAIAQIRTDLSIITESLSDVAAKVNDEETGIDALNTKLKQTIDGLNGAKGDIKALQTADESLQKNIDTVNLRVGSVITEITSLKESIEAHTLSIKDLTSRVAALETKLADITYVNKMLTGIVFKPECYINGVPGVVFEALVAAPLYDYDKPNTANEQSNFDFKAEFLSVKPVDITFDLNPVGAGITTEDITVEATTIEEKMNYYTTKAANDVNNIDATVKEVKGGKLIVTLKLSSPKAFTDGKTPIFQIKVTSKENSRTIISENIACAIAEVYDNTQLVIYTKEGKNYRAARTAYKLDSGGNNVSGTDVGAFNNYPAWEEDIDNIYAGRDTICPYDKDIDLKDKIKIGRMTAEGIVEMDPDTIVALGLTITFEKMDNYTVNNVKQWDYATLENGVVLKSKGDTAAIGKSPLVRVTVNALKGGSDVPVARAYYRPFFTNTAYETQELELNDVLQFDYDPNTLAGDSAKAGIQPLYELTGLDSASFAKEYTTISSNYIGKIERDGDSLKFSLTNLQIWEGGSYSGNLATVTFSSLHPAVYPNIIVNLIGTVLPVDKTVTITKELVQWYGEMTYYYVPVGEDVKFNPIECVFNSPINNSFVTEKDGTLSWSTPNEGLAKLIEDYEYQIEKNPTSSPAYPYSNIIPDPAGTPGIYYATYDKGNSKGASVLIEQDNAYNTVSVVFNVQIDKTTYAPVAAKILSDPEETVTEGTPTTFKAKFVSPITYNVVKTSGASFSGVGESNIDLLKAGVFSITDWQGKVLPEDGWDTQKDDLWQYYGRSNGETGFEVELIEYDAKGFGTLTLDSATKHGRTLVYTPNKIVPSGNYEIEAKLVIKSGWMDYVKVVTFPVNVKK